MVDLEFSFEKLLCCLPSKVSIPPPYTMNDLILIVQSSLKCHLLHRVPGLCLCISVLCYEVVDQKLCSLLLLTFVMHRPAESVDKHESD